MKLNFKKFIPVGFLFIFSLLFMFQNCSGGFEAYEAPFSGRSFASSGMGQSRNLAEFSLMNNNSALNLASRKTNFGFYGIVGWGTNYFNEVRSFSNTVWIAKESGDAIKAADTLKTLKEIEGDAEKLAIIDIQDVFFTDKLVLRSDFEPRWLKYQQNIIPFKNKILSFYFDEPYGWGQGAGVSFQTMQAQLEKVAELIKSTNLNEIPISISFTVNTTNLPIPRGIDWVGVDCYGSWDQCEGKSIPEHMEILKSKMNSNQRLILFADSALRNSQLRGTEQEQRRLLETFKKYFEYAQTEPLVVGVFAFIWQTIPEQNIVGLRDLKITQAEIIPVARQYIGMSSNNSSVSGSSQNSGSQSSGGSGSNTSSSGGSAGNPTSNPTSSPTSSSGGGSTSVSATPTTTPVSGSKICKGGVADISSADGSNFCHFEWGDVVPYETISTANGKMKASNGGSANAVCDKQLKWDHAYLCPSKSSKKSCVGGRITKYSSDGVYSCVFTFEQAVEGSDLKLVSTSQELNGGTLSGKCMPDGTWSYNYSCPSYFKKATCGGGAALVPSASNKDKQCYFTWAQTIEGQAAVNLQDSSGNGGFALGWVCKADGTYSQGLVSCP